MYDIGKIVDKTTTNYNNKICNKQTGFLRVKTTGTERYKIPREENVIQDITVSHNYMAHVPTIAEERIM